MSIKKILFISYHYYPDAEIGAQRTIKFARYLSEFGWQPYVLTVNSDCYPRNEPSIVENDCPVYRVGKWPIPDDLYLGGKRLLRNLFSSRKSDRDIPLIEHQGGEEYRIRRYSLVKRLYNSMNMTPDSQIGWYYPASREAIKLVNREGIDVIFSSGPPHTCHLVGLRTSKKTGVHWVADFRDPWAGSTTDYSPLLDWSRRFDNRFRRKTMETASLVLTTTNESAEMFRHTEKGINSENCQTIVNGFDEADFVDLRNRQASKVSESVTLFHGGTIYVGRNPLPLIEAMGELIKSGEENVSSVQLNFCGSLEIEKSEIDGLVSSLGLESVVQFQPAVARGKYLAKVMNSKVLILIQAQVAELQIPAKSYEYLASGNPILALVSKGATRNLLSKYEHVVLADPENVDEIRLALPKVLRLARSGTRLAPDHPTLAAITKQRLTGDLASLLDSLVNR